jgi:phospholipase/lecithinase/hemolysin
MGSKVILVALYCLLLGVVNVKSKTIKLVSFGDSLTDIGNTYEYTQESWPRKYGYPKHAFTNDETWLRYLQRKLTCKSNEQDSQKCFSNVLVENYAFGGATSDNTYVQGYTGPYSTWPVSGGAQQLQMYQTKPTVSASQTMYLIFLGTNDVFFQWVNGYNVLQAASKAAGNVAQIVDSLRTTPPLQPTKVVVFNCYPVELIPFATDYPASTFAGVSQTFNSVLAAALQKIRNNMTNDDNLELIDFQLTDFIKQTIDNAPAGVSRNTSCISGDYYSGTGSICNDPSQYVFYDSFHPTSWVHRGLAKKLLKQLF